ncbi:hypothetical protein [Bacteroides heparinolyticus]|uniref:hypothetical protein n=1 Tax=Prevotella heparinolytica TaxID=28113 RepID=UPI0035A02662
MKKKFDFSAEMSEAESIKATPKNEYLEEEKRLLKENVKELASLNDNVHYMITNLVNLLEFLQEYKVAIAQGTQEQVEKFGQSVLDKFLHQIQDKCNETERKIRKVDSHIFIPYTIFYILIIILVALSSFFASIIIANAEILHSAVIWKAAIGCILTAALGIGIAVAIQKFLDRDK